MALLRARVRLALAFFVVALATAGLSAQSPDERWTKALADFDAADHVAPPALGDVLFLGSSTIVNWDLVKTLPGIRALNRGVWSSSLYDAVQRIDRLVSCTPRA